MACSLMSLIGDDGVAVDDLGSAGESIGPLAEREKRSR
jgi:hypothetical protein